MPWDRLSLSAGPFVRVNAEATSAGRPSANASSEVVLYQAGPELLRKRVHAIRGSLQDRLNEPLPEKTRAPDIRWDRWLTVLLMVYSLGIALWLLTNGVHVTFDDGFYYFKIAQHIARGGGSSFDGITVTRVVENSPGYVAGVEVGDIVLEASGMKMNDPNQLYDLAETRAIGSAIKMRLERDNEIL